MAGMFTTRELQKLLQVDRSTIYRMAEAGRIPAVKVGKQWRFPEEKVAAWLELQSVTNGDDQVAAGRMAGRSFADLVPAGCAQVLLDAFADTLGVTLIVTDLEGEPLTAPSHPIRLYQLLDETELRHSICKAKWKQLAQDPDPAPRFGPGFGGMQCARALVLNEGEIAIAMVVVFGIAPEEWPPPEETIRDMGVMMKMPASKVRKALSDVPQLDPPQRKRTLVAVQRCAEILTLIGKDRCGLVDRLRGISELSLL